MAGTNGKGSTIAFMRAILESAGLAVHVYTSPHLVRFHERIRLGRLGGGRYVDEERLVEALRRCETVNAGEPITVFEITTAAAFLLFAETPADVLLLEVGLGGRVDATNVIDASGRRRRHVRSDTTTPNISERRWRRSRARRPASSSAVARP